MQLPGRGTATEEAALRAARRYEALGADGPAADRTVLLLLMATAATSLHLSSGMAQEILGILRAATTPTADGDDSGACAHPDGHARRGERTQDLMARVARLYEPDADAEAEAVAAGQEFGSEVLACPAHLRDVMAKGVADLEEQCAEEPDLLEQLLAE
ncbi:hypothetical protein OG893_13095 [Streptomyces sp. NBC_01696]|uniref:hypothetical protein n=1 Tax=Streptomyces sp. NBC_01696 TaxID=2975913 RepID=UPI002E2EBEF7|nr:hypothetical protein [Streptomyces sp. NBC_01696]